METPQALAAMAALSQESRLAVFRLLVRFSPEGLSAGEIARRLEITPATLSFHLSHLERAGLISRQREGRTIIYALEVDGIRGLLSFLTEDCCQGRPELCRPGADAACCPPQAAKKTASKKSAKKAAKTTTANKAAAKKTPRKRKARVS